jgi:uncharacterized protein (DUF1015 family)
MADIAPLTPLRYAPQTLASVVAPPYDVIDAAQREELARRDPHNVVRLILPEGDGDTKYANAAKILNEWRAKNVLTRDEEPAFYRYDQTFVAPGADANAKPITRRGFLALVKLSPFSERQILPHERTLSGPKEDRLKLFRATRTNLSPGFMLYRDPKRELDAPLARATALAEFTTPDGVRHALAKVTSKEAIHAIAVGVGRSSLLIADGHHRYETALRYSEEITASHANASARAEHRYFMSFLANGDDPNLLVFPTHRHVHSLAQFSFDDLSKRAEATFVVRALESGADVEAAVKRAGESGPSFAACAKDGRVAIFTLRKDVDLTSHRTLGARPAVLRKTDVALLHDGVLEHLLGITKDAQAAKTNIWYPQDARASLAELRAGKGDALFVMNATPVAQVREVAEAGEVMPQKSTFFYPKVLTGLCIHTLEPEREVADHMGA